MIPESIPVVYIVAGLVAALAGRWLFQKDTEIEDRRRAASRLAGVYRAAGLTHTAEMLEHYSVGDYSGMARKIKEAAALLGDETAAEKALSDLVARVREATKE